MTCDDFLAPTSERAQGKGRWNHAGSSQSGTSRCPAALRDFAAGLTSKGAHGVLHQQRRGGRR